MQTTDVVGLQKEPILCYKYRMKKGGYKKRDLQSVLDIVGSMKPLQHAEKKAASFDFLLHWDNVVGKQLASISKPEHLDKGTLSVRVIDAAWVQELSLMKHKIINTISEMGYAGAVSDIHFICGNPKNFRTHR